MAVAAVAQEQEVVTLGGINYPISEIKQLAEATGSSLLEAVVAFAKLQDCKEQKAVTVIPIDNPAHNFEYDNWGMGEIHTLIDNVLDVGYSGVAKMLPHRTYSAVVQKGRKLGLSIGREKKYQRWSQAEEAFLLNYRVRFTYNELGALLGRTGKAINNKWGKRG